MPAGDVVGAQLQVRLQFLGRDATMMLPSVLASDPARHDPNTFPVESLKKPHVLRTYNPASRAIQKQREHEPQRPLLAGNLLRLKAQRAWSRKWPSAPPPGRRLGECCPPCLQGDSSRRGVIECGRQRECRRRLRRPGHSGWQATPRPSHALGALECVTSMRSRRALGYKW